MLNQTNIIQKGSMDIKGIPVTLQLSSDKSDDSFLRDKIGDYVVEKVLDDYNIDEIGSIKAVQYKPNYYRYKKEDLYRNGEEPGSLKALEDLNPSARIEAKLCLEIMDKTGKIIDNICCQIYWDAGEEEHMRPRPSL